MFKSAFVCLFVMTAFNANAQLYKKVASMNVPRSHFETLLLPDGRVLAIGGYVSNGDFSKARITASTEIYDPVKDTWSFIDSMRFERAFFSSILLNSSTLFVTNGVGSNGIRYECEMLDIKNFMWIKTILSNRAKRKSGLARLTNGNILTFGGTSGLMHTEVFDTSKQIWNFVSDNIKNLSVGSGLPNYRLNKDEILIFGSGQPNIFDERTNTFKKAGNGYFSTSFPSLFKRGNKIIVIGGNLVGEFDLGSYIYVRRNNPPSVLDNNIGISLLNGDLLFFSSAYYNNPADLECLQVYNTHFDTWHSAGIWGTTYPGTEAYEFVRLNNNEILLCGGIDSLEYSSNRCFIINENNVTLSNTTAISDLHDLQIYSGTGQVILKVRGNKTTNQNLTLSIFDSSGRLIEEQLINLETSHSISLKSGLYIFRIAEGTSVVVKKALVF